MSKTTPDLTLVNRVARPFYGEALRMLAEGLADHETIDRLVERGGGFRMGPFRLIDLIGVDINYAAMQSMYDQSFSEPRYRPHWIQARMVAQGRLGRKSGRGFYSYTAEETSTSPEPQAGPAPAAGTLWISEGGWAPGLAALVETAGFDVQCGGDPQLSTRACVVVAGREEGLREIVSRVDRSVPQDVPLFCQAADVTVAEIASWVEHPWRLVGFDGLFLNAGQMATLVAGPGMQPELRAAVETLLGAMGRPAVWVADLPGLVLPRLVCMLANEAAIAVMEGVAAPETIDLAMRLGVNYPHGPLTWATELGLGRVAAVLDHLQREYGEDCYRVAPLLRRWSRLGEISPW